MKRFILIIINVILLSTILYADEKFILIIDPGHGGKDPGCIGQKNVKEKDVVLDIALKLGNYIENNNKDVKVVYTRKTDIYLTLKERARIANKNKGDLFISIHADAIPAGKNSSTAYGAGTFTMGVAHSAENLEMAKRENTVILFEDDYQTSYASFNPKSSESYLMFEFLQ